jgi:hypothetical protein
MKLCDKRQDKLMDFESALSLQNEFKATGGSSGQMMLLLPLKDIETQVAQTKKDYEAMNYQLIEDLAKLTECSSYLIVAAFKSFSLLTSHFLSQINHTYKQNIQQITSASEFKPLTQQITDITKAFSRESIHHYAATETQSNSDRQRLSSKYSPDMLYKVSQSYVANLNLCQLKQNIDDLVGVIKKYDPGKQSHIWFVDNGSQQGFIPEAALTPYYQDNEQKNNDEFCIALYNFKMLAENMIDLSEGHLYKVIEKCDKKRDAQWWLVQDSKSRLGYVPSNYVKLLID